MRIEQLTCHIGAELTGVQLADAVQFGADRTGERFDAHGPTQMTKIDEPVVRRASRSRCACAASSSA